MPVSKKKTSAIGAAIRRLMAQLLGRGHPAFR